MLYLKAQHMLYVVFELLHSTLQPFGGLLTESELIPDTKTDKLVPHGDLILDLIPDIQTDKLIPDLVPEITNMQY